MAIVVLVDVINMLHPIALLFRQVAFARPPCRAPAGAPDEGGAQRQCGQRAALAGGQQEAGGAHPRLPRPAGPVARGGESRGSGCRCSGCEHERTRGQRHCAPGAAVGTRGRPDAVPHPGTHCQQVRDARDPTRAIARRLGPVLRPAGHVGWCWRACCTGTVPPSHDACMHALFESWQHGRVPQLTVWLFRVNELGLLAALLCLQPGALCCDAASPWLAAAHPPAASRAGTSQLCPGRRLWLPAAAARPQQGRQRLG